MTLQRTKLRHGNMWLGDAYNLMERTFGDEADRRLRAALDAKQVRFLGWGGHLPDGSFKLENIQVRRADVEKLIRRGLS